MFSLFTTGRDILRENVDFTIEGKTLAWQKNPVYLGVRLDQKLTLTGHIRDLCNKSSRRLNILKKLTHTRWGSDAKLLRAAYLGYVRGLVEYGLPILAHANKTALELLDRVQNQGLRLITGAYRTTPTEDSKGSCYYGREVPTIRAH